MCRSVNIEQEIIKIVSNNTVLSTDLIDGNSRLQIDLGADSLDMVVIVMEIESIYEIDLNDEVIEKYGDEIRVSDLVYETESAIKENVNNG